MDTEPGDVEFVLAHPVDNVGTACAQHVQWTAANRMTPMSLWTPVEQPFPAPQVTHTPDRPSDLRVHGVIHDFHRPYYYDHPTLSLFVSVEHC